MNASTISYTTTQLIFTHTHTCNILAHRICSDVVAGVVTKCLNARPKTKEASIQVCLMCVEIEQHAVVQVSQVVFYM